MSGQLRECQAFAVVDPAGVIQPDCIRASETEARIAANSSGRFHGSWRNVDQLPHGYTVQRVTVSSAGFDAGIAAAAKVARDAETMWGDDFTKKYGDITAEQAIRSLSPGGIEARSAEAGWQPIDLDPQKWPEPGRYLVCADTDDGPYVCEMQLTGKEQWEYEGEPTFCHSFYIEPKFWQPLPLPAQCAKGEG